MEVEDRDEITKKSAFKWKRWLLFLIIVLLFPVILSFLLQFKVFQNWALGEVTSHLSREFEGEIKVGEVDVSIFDGVQLKEFVLVDKKDTILYAKAINVGLRSSLLTLYNNTLDISRVSLESPRVRIIKEKGNKEAGITILLQKLLGSPSPDDEKKKTDLNIEEIDLTDGHVVVADYNNNTIQDISIDRAYINVKSYDDKKLAIRSVHLSKPKFSLQKITGSKTIMEATHASVIDTVSEAQRISIDNVVIDQGEFLYRDHTSAKPFVARSLNTDNIGVTGINVEAQKLSWDGNKSLYVHIDQLALKEKNGFEIKELVCPDLHISDTNVSLPSFRLRTANSNIRRTFSMEYDSFSDFGDFENKVTMHAQLQATKLGVRDLLYFVPVLSNVPYFQEYSSAINVDGYIAGTVNSLIAKDLHLRSGNLILKGDITTRDITQKHKEYLDVKIDTLHTDIATLTKIIPRFRPIKNLYSLGNIAFNGRFTGLIQNFHTEGIIQTDIGKGILNLNFDTSKDIATYGGDLAVDNFDLGKWSGNPKLGMTSFSGEIKNGKGLSLDELLVDINARIAYLEYNDYRHQNFNMDGKFANKSFKGAADIDNEDACLTINGLIDVNSRLPEYRFTTEISKLHIDKLGLHNRLQNVQGTITVDAIGNTLDSLTGVFSARGLQMITRDDEIYAIDSIHVVSRNDDNDKYFDLSSDIGDVSIHGEFDFRYMIPVVRASIEENYTSYWSGTRKSVAVTDEQVFDFDIDIHDTKNFLPLLTNENLRFYSARLTGNIDTRDDVVNIKGSIDSIIGTVSMQDAHIDISSVAGDGDISVMMDSLVVSGIRIPYTKIEGDIADGTYDFDLLVESVLSDSNYVDVNIKGQKVSDGYTFKVRQDSLHLMSTDWTIDPNNELTIREKSFDLDQLSLTDGYRSIRLEDIGKKGISLNMDRFDFKSIDRTYIRDKYIHMTGEGNVEVFVDNLYSKDANVIGRVEMLSFYINNDDFGRVTLYCIKGNKDIVDVNLNLAKGDTSLVMVGEYNIAQGDVAATIKSSLVPMRLFEHLLVSGIHDTYGGLDVDAVVSGNINDLKLKGTGLIHKAGTTVDYTQAAYNFDQQTFTFDEKFIDVTGGRIYDEDGDYGTITGGITHDFFRRFGLRVNITGNNVLVLNTKKLDNPVYYGRGKGFASVDFNGPIDEVNMKMNCIAKKGTTINIPIQSTTSNVENNFLTFVKKEELLSKQEEKEKKVKFDALDVEVELTLTPDATVNLIFDEAYGDVIKGQGRGNMKMYISRLGDFNIYGNYDIESGEYLFTALGFIAKSFDVRKGSRIVWTGDPIDATLDVVADYSVRAPLNTFLAEYLTAANSKESTNKTDIDLQLILGNTLYNPSVNFDLSFPNVTGDLRSLVESKLYTLKNNQSDLNNQVMGLIVFNSFLPSNTLSGVGGRDYQAAGISTISEFVSSQLSHVFTGMLNEALTEDGLISGIDFDIGLHKNSFLGVNTNSGFLPDEIEVQLKNRFRFWDERLSLNVGGNYVRAPIVNIQEYIIGDFILEYFLTDDRKLKLRMYGKYDYDEAATDRRLKYGVGIGYRTEFGSMISLKDRLLEDLKGDIRRD